MKAELLMLSLLSSFHNVAIKIFRSAFKSGDHIVTSLERLRSGPNSHPGKKHIAQLLDHFELKGPNGNHLCLVSTVLGDPACSGTRSIKRNWVSAKQAVEATAYAHEQGVVHGSKLTKISAD